jgi:ribosomal-protein-alanine N-acetyltransferase
MFNYSYANVSDVNEMYKIEKKSFSTPWAKRDFFNVIDNEYGISLLIRNEKKIIGFIILLIVIDEIHIIDLAVTMEWRRQGIAKDLIARVEETFKKCRCMWLEVRQSNEISINLYKSLNFNHIMTRKRYYTDTNEDALILYKELQNV